MTRLEIATVVRENAEWWAAQNARDPSLNGMCAMCALAVEIAFQRQGYNRTRSFFGSYRYAPTETMDWHFGHCWTESYEDELDTIYDVTATQFSAPKICVIREDDPLYERYCNKKEVISRHNTTFWDKWHLSQRPTAENLAVLLRNLDVTHLAVAS